MGAINHLAGNVHESCCECGVSFWFDIPFFNRKREDGTLFYCPNGHSQLYRETTNQKLQKELDQEKKRRQWAEDSANRARKEAETSSRRARAYKGVLTKTKSRIANGVCPCCNRTFQNLMGHMKTKHPKYKVKK